MTNDLKAFAGNGPHCSRACGSCQCARIAELEAEIGLLKREIASRDAWRVEETKALNAAWKERERAEAACAELRGALEGLLSAARGMPISHDNLCQGTLDHACNEAEEALAAKEPSDG